MIYRRIDEKGFFKEDIEFIGDVAPKNYIKTPVIGSFLNPFWDGRKWIDKPTSEMIQLENERILKAKKNDISFLVYSEYTMTKQSQDLMWSNSFLTKLKAMGEEKVEFTVVSMAGQFFKGKTINEIMKPIRKDLKHFYEKLLKISIRTEWAERCVKEGVTAIKEGREPNYPKFPKL